MSQIASLFSIDKVNFGKLSKSPKILDPAQVCIEHVTFHQTHEGLQYVLSKGQTEDMLDLVAGIFYPLNWYGQTVELETIDSLEVDDDFNVGEPVFYHAPGKVHQISKLLQAIDEESFLANFDAEELNSEDVYPGTWNNEEKGRAFNSIHLSEDLDKLKLFFAKAAGEGCYVLVFV